MKETVNEPGNLILVEYSGIIHEFKLNWGFKRGYFEEEKIPVLFIYSNFPNNISTNRQSLVGSIRTHVEEQKGIIFFPIEIKEELKQVVQESLKKEKVEMDFCPYLGKKYESIYLGHICDMCFSIKNINIKEVIMIGKPLIQHEMIENLAKGNNQEVSAFVIDKLEKRIIEAFNLEQRPSPIRKISFQDLVKNKTFKSRFFELFLGEGSVPERIKRFYGGKGWKFDSLLIFYYGRKKRVFIQDLHEGVFFLNSNDATFQSLNTKYSLIHYSYKSDLDQKIIIVKNKITEKFDIWVDGKLITDSDFNRDISHTFLDCAILINQFLQMITHSQLTEYRFFYDKMAVVVKIVGAKYFIESYVAN